SCQASSTDRPDRQGPRAGAAPWPYTTLFRSEAIRQKEPAPFEPSTKVRKTLAVFHAISFCRRKYGQPAIGPFIVSMTQGADGIRSEEHTSELQSRENLVCRLLLERKDIDQAR